MTTVAINENRLERAFSRLQNFPERNANLDEYFRELIITASDDELNRIRPYKLAQNWNMPLREVLSWLLYGGQVGLFDLNWETVCPMCGGTGRDHAHRPGDLAHEMTCPTCTNHYHVHFDEQVQVTFDVSPNVRSTQPSVYVYLPSGAVGEEFDTTQPITINLDQETRYLLLDMKGIPFAFLDVTPEAAPLSVLEIDYDPRVQQIFNVPLGKLQANLRGIDRLILGHRDGSAAPGIQEVSGLETALLPAFQKLFSQDTLSQRESLSIRNLTILFTDITGSTALYQRLGDVKAYNLVRDHFEVLFGEIERHNGTVVKTIGDAVMAAFYAPEDALQAALAVQSSIREFNRDRNPDEGLILVKIGMHMGSVIAVNLNDRLDYFGNMVNLAARVQGQSRSTEILLSEEVYHDSAVQRLLKSTPDVRVTESVFELAGIEKSQRLFSVAFTTEM